LASALICLEEVGEQERDWDWVWHKLHCGHNVACNQSNF